MGLEDKPEAQAPTYRDRMIVEVEGYISLFSGDNIFAARLDETGVRQKALESYQAELAALHGLPLDVGDAEVQSLHDSYECQREQLI